jgi:hypothetical protein
MPNAAVASDPGASNLVRRPQSQTKPWREPARGRGLGAVVPGAGDLAAVVEGQDLLHARRPGELDDGQPAVGVAHKAEALSGGIAGLADELAAVVDVGHGGAGEAG